MPDWIRFIRDVPDFPKPGIVFKDITPLLRDGKTFEGVVAELSKYARSRGAHLVAGIEARGFVFAAAVASNLGVGFVPLRKKGKLPWKTVRETYALEYGEDSVEAHADAVRKGEKIVLIDDVLATGGTLSAGCRLIERIGGSVVGCATLIELSALKGRKKLGKRNFHSLLSV